MYQNQELIKNTLSYIENMNNVKQNIIDNRPQYYCGMENMLIPKEDFVNEISKHIKYGKCLIMSSIGLLVYQLLLFICLYLILVTNFSLGVFTLLYCVFLFLTCITFLLDPPINAIKNILFVLKIKKEFKNLNSFESK